MASRPLLIQCFLFSVVLCAAQRSAPVPMNAATESRLQKDIPSLMEKAGVPVLSIAVIRDGKTAWTGSFGVRNTATNEPVTENTLFNVGSLSKPGFAYGVLKLVAAGKMKPAQPLAPYLPKETTDG